MNPGSLGLEIAVYVPIWRLVNLAATRYESTAAMLTAVAGSAVVIAAVHEQDVTAGRYPALVMEQAAPDLLGGCRGGRLVSAGEATTWASRSARTRS
ncbi:MAG: hypothetical protein WAL16_18090, partial [Streptosporangiaceae bacterium]